jgi:hypothetical protein
LLGTRLCLLPSRHHFSLSLSLSPSLEKDMPRGKRVFRFKAQLGGFMGMFVDNDSSKMGTRFISSGLLYFA